MSTSFPLRAGKVIEFPTQPPFAEPRQRGTLSNTELKRKIDSYLPELLPGTYADIVRTWREGVQMGYIAKMHQLRKVQVEAIIWATDQGWDPRARLAVVQERRAA